MRRSALTLLTIAAACSGRVQRLPATATALRPCASASNCVSSESTDPGHHVDPIPYTGDHITAMQQLRDVIEDMPRAEITDADDIALHAEFTSRLLPFVDDVDCVADPQAHVIAIRAESRVGYLDAGVSRKRVEEIREAFLERTA